MRQMDVYENDVFDFEEDMKKKDNINLSISKSYAKQTKVSMKDFDTMAVMNDYWSGDPAKKEAAIEAMVNQLDNFIYSIIFQNYGTYAQAGHLEDMVNSGRLGVIANMDQYDPTKGTPTTFFKLRIIHEIQEYLNMMVNKMSTHYATNSNKIQKVINKYESEGKNWTIHDLRTEIKGVSEETIQKCLHNLRYKNEVYYDSDEISLSQLASTVTSPETAFIENEKNQALYEALWALDKTERVVVMLRYGFGHTKPLSWKDIANRLDLQIEEVKRHAKHALPKLQSNQKLNLIFKSNLVNYINRNNIPLNNTKDAELVLEKVSEIPLIELENSEGQMEVFFSL